MAKGDPRLGNGGEGYFPAIYQSALAQTGEDYDKIMGEYDQLGKIVKDKSSSGGGRSAINPTFTKYEPGSDYSELRDIANTGGFSEDDISNIRERAISPVRSIYSSANRELARQKNLSGGYAPNFAAASAKMARESSNLISDRTTAANAQIAQLVQQGKLSGATALAPLEARENEFRNSISQHNADTANQIAELNSRFSKEDDNTDFDKILETIKGKQSLFGTTPGEMSTIGSHVLNAANTVNNFAPITRSSSSSVKMPYYKSYTGLPQAGVNYNGLSR